ncbi:hypothetical protein ACOI1H_12330 [Loktanella sp. DJP18]|uniref:hypothetical protein n=1 Tax=Loktanella sp. DJP18 TaxID=3409788 RepID=UPI003BB76B97
MFGKIDGGVQFVIGTGDVAGTPFTLSHADQPLTFAKISRQDFGVRLTSVGKEGTQRTGSLKPGEQR